jgi:hypothetical protein
MSKYNPSDDGKTIDGKIVVFIYPAGAAPQAGAAPGTGTDGSTKEYASSGAATPGASSKDGGASAKDGGTAAKRAAAGARNTDGAAQAAALTEAAKAAVPFCEECEKARKEHEQQA